MYNKGDKVRVVNIGSPMWEPDSTGNMLMYDSRPEAIGNVGEIEDSSDSQGIIKYIIKWPEEVKLHSAWWYEYQLEPEYVNTPRKQQAHYPDYKESNTAKELSKCMKEIVDDIEEELMWKIKEEDNGTERTIP